MMRITAVEISKKSKCAKQTAIWKSLKALQTLYTLCALFSRVTMMHITGGEISNKSKRAKKMQFQNVGKHCKSDIRSVQKSETII